MNWSPVRQFLVAHFEIGATGRLLPMEGMRGFAALLVFFVHFDALFGGYFRPGSLARSMVDVWGGFGHVGVDLFFVLSGFLIYGIVLKGKYTYARYVLHRARRLYPTFLAILAVYLVLSLTFPRYSKIPGPFPENLVYIIANLAMLPGITRIVPIITVAWSLSYEWFFYLLLPLIVSGLVLRRWLSGQRILVFLSLSAVQFLLCVTGLSSHMRLIMFASGIILWELMNYQTLPSRLKAWGEYAAILIFAANLAVIGLASAKHGETPVLLLRIPGYYSGSLFGTAFLLTLYAFSFDGVLKRFFSWNYLRWMGNISYSYYLVHALALHGVRLLLGHLMPIEPRTTLFGLALLVVCILATVFCGAMLFLFIEKPLSLRRARDARNPVASPP